MTKKSEQNGHDQPQILDDLSKVNIRPLSKDEKPNVSATVDGDRVDYHYEVGGGTAVGVGKSHQAHSVLDFSHCTKEEILRLASKPVIIAAQRRWNVMAKDDLKKATAPGTLAYIDVKRDIIDASRQSAPASAKADKIVSKMSQDEKAKLLAKLQAEMEAAE